MRIFAQLVCLFRGHEFRIQLRQCLRCGSLNPDWYITSGHGWPPIRKPLPPPPRFRGKAS